MALWGRSLDKNYGDKNIRQYLENRLAELRETSPEYIEKQINVMDTVYDFIGTQLQSRLKEERKLHKGERISIIPYNLGGSHWAGLLIEFDASGRLRRAEYMDMINASNIIPTNLKNQFVEIYDDNILQVRHIQRRDGTRSNHELQLIEHLLAAITNNRNQLGTGSLSRLSELRKMRDGKLRMSKISELTVLSEEIHRTEQKIREYEKNGNFEKMNRKLSKLTELKDLLDLSREISMLESSLDADELRLDEMRKRLQKGLEKFKISDMRKLPERIDETKQRIEDCQKRKRLEKMEEAKSELNELIALQQLHERIRVDTDLIQNRETRLKNEYEILCEDLLTMPDCAEKSVIELIQYFQQRLMKVSHTSLVKYSIDDSLKNLHNQLQRQKISSKEIRANLEDLEIHIRRKDCVSTLESLKKILKEIRPLNVREVQRLVSRSEKAAELIRDKDVVVLFGTSRSGKSKIIQFIMSNEVKEIETVDLRPRHHAPTRCIEPITVSLRGVFHTFVDEFMILCDVPAFDSSVDIEVDITNGLGAIEALKGCSSVKILALSTRESLYDKSSGIQKTINILTSILDGVEDHLDSVCYAFAKYSSVQEIISTLLTMQASKVTSNFLKSDVPVVKILDDIIGKTKNGVNIVDSSLSDAKHLIDHLKVSNGIRDPDKFFRYTMREETRNAILNQLEIYKATIRSAVECKHIALIMYYLNNLSILKNLLKQNFILEAHEAIVHAIKESILQDYSVMIERFDKFLRSENALKDQEIHNFMAFIDYIKDTERLGEHLGEDALSATAIIQNMESELRKRSDELVKEDLRSPSVKVFLDSLRKLKHSLKSLESGYNLTCKDFSENFDKLVKSAHESIRCNQFEKVAAILLVVSETSDILRHHLGKQIEEKYHQTVRFLIEHLASFVDKAGTILIKLRLNNDDVKDLNGYIEILRSAKENSILQDRVFTYFEILRSTDHILEENLALDLNEIYSKLIEKLITYFDDINRRIQEVLRENDSQSLETIEQIIVTMDMIRKIPEIEAKMAASYCRMIEIIREYAQQLEKDTRKLIDVADTESEENHHTLLTKLVSTLEKVKWIDRISPGTYDRLMRHIRDHVIQYAYQLENRLQKLDMSLKYHENIKIAQQFLERIDFLCIRIGSIQKLEECRQRTMRYFYGSVMSTFDLIQNTFILQDNTVYQFKQELSELEEAKREYESIYLPSVCTELSNHYSNNSKTGSRQTSYSLDHVETMKKMYTSLTTNTATSSIKIDYLQKKGLHNYDSLPEHIQCKRATILELEKNKKSYDFSRKFEGSIASMALKYLNNCEKGNYIRLREIAIETSTILKRYVIEYGCFLDEQINGNFRKILSNDLHENYSEYSDNLEKRLQEFFLLKKYPDVFERIDGVEKEENFHRMFRDYHRKLSAQIEDCRIDEKTKQLQDHLIVAQALSCVDIFCPALFGDNGFRALYIHYQVEMNRQSKATYTAVLDQISKTDYGSVAILLSRMNDRLLDENDLFQIGFELQNSLYKLMATIKANFDVLFEKIGREEDNKDSIEEIKEKLDKIQFVFSRANIHELLDKKTKLKIETFLNDIPIILSEIFVRTLNTIDVFISMDNFSEAEHSMNGLTVLQRELAMYCTSTDLIGKIEQMKQTLENIVHDILQRDFEDITKYSMNSPKDLVEKFKLAGMRGNPRFTQGLNRILEKIRKNFNEAMNQVYELSVDERTIRLCLLHDALNYLPDELQTESRLHLDALSKTTVDQKKERKRELDDALNNANGDDDHAIENLGTLADRYFQENANELFEELRRLVLQKLSIHRENLVSALDRKDMRSAIAIVEKLAQYNKFIGSHFTEIGAMDKNIYDLLVKNFILFCDTLANVSKIEQMYSVEEAFDNIIIYIGFATKARETSEKLMFGHVFETVRITFQRVYEYFHEISTKYHTAIKVMHIVELRRALIIAKHCDALFQKIKQCRVGHESVLVLLKNIKRAMSYADMIDELQKHIKILKDHLNVELVMDETTRFENRREEFFRNLMKSIDTLIEIDSQLKDILPFYINVDVLKNELKQKVQKLVDRLVFISSKSDLSVRDTDNFRMLYNYLVSLDKYESRIGLSIRPILDDSEEKILDHVSYLTKTIRSMNLDASNVAQILTNMKFFSENLPMFDSKINQVIDEVLTYYKQKEGPSMLMHLTMILEKTDIGGRIISEHSSLNGEDWRKRREKMQNQDNLDYVLKELTGDDIATDILSSCYQKFRESYDNQISQILATFNQKDEREPNLEAVILKAKALIGRTSQETNRIVWSRSFVKTIPELLACIFAVWTLKNTQHYNSIRGVDSARAYLLMPHAAQVLAIFRLLGIGYESAKKNADGLINNLVEIGTGEGKSVVMAITACVFALIGVDVNCSCYSEILSTRDKNDFASVFRAFDVEERIEYGTFNKLCENLLNKQCNIRDKVRDMILSNQNKISVIEKVTNLRLKVLLIDEVDVFLSDKFYGGAYTPSVFIRDPSIKALLDAIWKNKTLKNLSNVQSTLEYHNCNSRFCNWTILLDEAIKDMIIALESFRSSTHIVQNDKIVYVEGESIVENIVRGYDTVWSYYQENADGNISESSLQANVGIIINCGMFSYAEMPHEFSYIAGVTGTLRTLDKTEIDILTFVYGVQKNTFMPSVFGKCNRIFNPNNDVLVVDESEYFMRIRGEIDNVCNANRAILVFFESENKLMKFYHSQELISKKIDIQIITEKVSMKERELFIKRAAMIGRITLLTRTFGRGIDFICRNQQLLLNGGMHVLQTFFSEELSEEYQIMGRGARQGDFGSYRMILLDKDLEWILGSTWKQVLPQISGTHLYRTLNEYRDKIYQSKCAAKQLNIDRCKRDHEASIDFMLSLLDGDMKNVKMFLLQQNRGANLNAKASRTVLLIDATCSMSNLLSAAKETICTMFERASEILKENMLDSDVIQMQIAVYRNYNSDQSKILQVSSWETKANSLRSFLNTISCEGGWGHEAIEIGLCHAVRESNTQSSISQVILIGDAPANTMTDIHKKRDNLGEEYWAQTTFNKPTYYEYELDKLKKKNIPVHAFYLTSFAESDFRKIANKTGGRCEYLDIHSTDGATFLTDFVTEEILRNAAGEHGDDIVESYRMKYTTYIF